MYKPGTQVGIVAQGVRRLAAMTCSSWPVSALATARDGFGHLTLN